MSTVPFPGSRRRALLLGAAIVLLHWLALRWLGGQVGARRELAFEPMPMVARLLAPEPPPAAPAPPRPVRKPAPRLQSA
ncbi:MAG: DUF3108 domain-containing protein, partial [Massilia sp.]